MAERSTEARHPASQGLHLAASDAVLTALLDAQIAALSAVRPAFPAIEAAAEAAASALRSGHRMIYAGAGSSGLMALADGLELAGTFGIAPDRTPILLAGGTAALLHMQGAVEDDPALAASDLVRTAPGPGDVVICISASGTTPYTLEIARGAKARGARIIGMANVAGSALLTLADIAVLMETGAEVVSGSTRMGAATAQKAALNMLSVRVGIKLGHVHDGYMVNVVADNAKLMDRAARIVAAIAECDMAAARQALDQSDGAVKPAILIARGVAAQAAIAALNESGGLLGPALAATTARQD